MTRRFKAEPDAVSAFNRLSALEFEVSAQASDAELLGNGAAAQWLFPVEFTDFLVKFFIEFARFLKKLKTRQKLIFGNLAIRLSTSCMAIIE